MIQCGGKQQNQALQPLAARAFIFRLMQTELAMPQNKKALALSQGLILLSGGQDSNLRPPGPKPGILPG